MRALGCPSVADAIHPVIRCFYITILSQDEVGVMAILQLNKSFPALVWSFCPKRHQTMATQVSKAPASA